MVVDLLAGRDPIADERRQVELLAGLADTRVGRRDLAAVCLADTLYRQCPVRRALYTVHSNSSYYVCNQGRIQKNGTVHHRIQNIKIGILSPRTA